jgi:hypothetical protein
VEQRLEAHAHKGSYRLSDSNQRIARSAWWFSSISWRFITVSEDRPHTLEPRCHSVDRHLRGRAASEWRLVGYY